MSNIEDLLKRTTGGGNPLNEDKAASPFDSVIKKGVTEVAASNPDNSPQPHVSNMSAIPSMGVLGSTQSPVGIDSAPTREVQPSTNLYGRDVHSQSYPVRPFGS